METSVDARMSSGVKERRGEARGENETDSRRLSFQMFGRGESVKSLTCHYRFKGLPFLVVSGPRPNSLAKQEAKDTEDQRGPDNRACYGDVEPLHTVGKTAECNKGGVANQRRK